jgi:DNA-3-methyladenine glycosylase I
VRSRAKIEAAIKGAKLWLEIEEKEPGGFTQFIWKHVDGKPQINRFKSTKQVPAKTPMSEGLAKELKQRGFNFCGPVIVYAFAQAVGMVNDHIVSCHRHTACEKLAQSAKRRAPSLARDRLPHPCPATRHPSAAFPSARKYRWECRRADTNSRRCAGISA